MGSVGNLRSLRREAAAAGLNPKPKLVGPRPRVADGPCWDKRVNAWTLPFPGELYAVKRHRVCVQGLGCNVANLEAEEGGEQEGKEQ